MAKIDITFEIRRTIVTRAFYETDMPYERARAIHDSHDVSLVEDIIHSLPPETWETKQDNTETIIKNVGLISTHSEFNSFEETN